MRGSKTGSTSKRKGQTESVDTLEKKKGKANRTERKVGASQKQKGRPSKKGVRE